MFKRLIFAVFVLGLILTFSGTAISDIGQKDGLNPVMTMDPSAPLYGFAVDGRPDQTNLRIPAGEFQQISAADATPTPPSGYFCDVYTYWCDSTASFYIWNMRGYNLTYLANRFTVEGLDVCTLTVQWARILTHSAYQTGDPVPTLYVWDDDFGFPGTLRASHTLAAAPSGPTWTWLGADFYADNIIYGPGDEYHVGIGFTYDSPDDAGWTATDMGQPWLDHSGQTRGSFHDGTAGAWGTVLDMTGGDYAPIIESEWCGYETPFSDCYDLSYYTNAYWVWQAPHPGYGFSEWATRFTVNGPETLNAIQVSVYDFTAWGEPTAIPGNDDIIITVYGDDGLGYPNDADVKGTVTIPAYTYPFYPTQAYADFSGQDLVFAAGENFFVTFASTGAVGTDFEVLVGDDGGTNLGRGYVRDDPGFVGPLGAWSTMMTMYGGDELFHMVATMCIDPYSDCRALNYCQAPDYFWYLPDTYGSTANAQQFNAVGTDCKIGEVSFALYDNGDPSDYTTDSRISLYLDGGGVPALEMAFIDVGPGTAIPYVLQPGRTMVDFGPLEIYLTGKYWISIESYGNDETDGIRTLSDLGGSGQDFTAAELWNGTWGLMTNNWVGVPADIAFDAEADFCCIPLPEWPCFYVGEWPTAQFDAGRSGHAQVHTGAPNEDLILNWNYDDPTAQAYFSSPMVYDSKIMLGFDSPTDYWKVFDLNTGALLWQFEPPGGNYLRGTPLATNLGGTDYVFFTGGYNSKVYCYNYDTFTLIWTFEPGSGNYMRYATMQLLNLSGTDVLFVGDDNGNIYAIDANLGTLYTGSDWATTNPISVGQPMNHSGATDGAYLYYSLFTSGLVGDVVAIRASDGYQVWSLYNDWGLEAGNVYPTEAIAGEGFQAGVVFDAHASAPSVYAASYVADGDHPADGVIYKLNAADGAPQWAVAGARSLFTTPLMDQVNFYMGFFSRWQTPPIGGNLVAYNKASGTPAWKFTHPNDDNYYNDIAMTCEDDSEGRTEDLIFVGGHKGFMSCIRSWTGEQLFDRQINYGDPFASMFNGIAIVPGDGVDYKYHVVASHFYGGLSVQSAPVTRTLRPRLEIQSYNPNIAVEFGSATSLPTWVPDLLLNTGGSGLTIFDIWTDEDCPAYHPEFSSVRPDVADRAMTIASQLTSDKLLKATKLEAAFDQGLNVRDSRSELSLNAGAMARPAFIQVGTDPDGILYPPDDYVMAPGELISVQVDVNQSLINRGAQPFSMYVVTDDPDFYLNPSPVGGPTPCIYVTIVGGCLLDTANLDFGMGCANIQVVTNTGRMGTGDWDPHGFDIDGDADSYYQGSYVYGVSQYSIAMNTQDWHGGGESDSYWSMQADPNWYDGECAPPYVTGHSASCFGGYTENGYDYTPLVGNAVYKTYIDSVQNFDLGSGWNWTNFGAPFDDALTMGLKVNSVTIGVCDFEPLKDVTVEIIEVSERNGLPVTDWAMGTIVDYDIGGDSAYIDRSISTAWSASASGGDVAWGVIKLPFGCGMSDSPVDFEPMWNVGALDANQANWADVYWDSAYYYTTLPAGSFGHTIAGTADQQFHATFVHHDFPGDGSTYMFAIANFGMSGLADAQDPAEFAPLANLVNKWVGFGRGDVNNDNLVDIRDLVYLKNFRHLGGPGPIPFMHLGDVDVDGDIDLDDEMYLFNWYFNDGDCPKGDWCFFE